MAFVVLMTMGTPMWLTRMAILEQRHAREARARATSSGSVSSGSRHAFTATAYCKGQTTSAGVAPRRGIIASDPAILPLGSVVAIDASDDRMDGLYSVLDTGPKIRGRVVDLYLWSCHEALAFGRQRVELTVLRSGWNPAAINEPAVGGR